MKKPIPIILCLIIWSGSFAQTVSDILESGIVVKPKEKIFLEWKNKTIRYDVGTTPSDFLTLSDSSYFLLMEGGVNIYIKPLNPLNLSTSTAITFSKDQIDEEEAKAFSSIKDVLAKILSGVGQPPTPSPSRSTVDSCYLRIVDDITKATDLLSQDQKPELTDIFKDLKKLGFQEENETIDAIKS
ncbi:MAG TPA: hypothetical protein VFV08_03325, partial [Puia sp.]|nr:hypothetical protein [Puia sp.]